MGGKKTATYKITPDTGGNRSILTNAGNAADLLSTRYIIRLFLNVPTALPLSMKPDTANPAAQKSTRVQRNGSAPYANKNYIMKGVDSCGSESGNELAGAMRLRPEGNETHKGLSPPCMTATGKNISAVTAAVRCLPPTQDSAPTAGSRYI